LILGGEDSREGLEGSVGYVEPRFGTWWVWERWILDWKYLQILFAPRAIVYENVTSK
jgi:hypothetical protein